MNTYKRFNLSDVVIIKKNGTRESFKPEKILTATQKSANRIAKQWTEKEKEDIIRYVIQKIKESGEIEFHIDAIHSMVEYALDRVNPRVANQYRNYRNWKQKSLQIFDEMEQVENTIRYIGDRSNANKDASLVATKRSLIYGEYSTKRYEMSFLNEDEKQAAKDGYIYIHDKDSRLDTINCCLFNLGHVMKDGFLMGNMWYNEPNTLDTAFDVMGDIILATAAQQYGGFTIPEVDKVLLPYAKKSYNKYFKEYLEENLKSKEEMLKMLKINISEETKKEIRKETEKEANEYAFRKTQRECEQGMQGIEYKLNTVGS